MQTKTNPTKELLVPPLLTSGHVPTLGHLLITEMDPALGKALQGRLIRSGYSATFMRSGVEARWSLFSARYDALIVSLDHADCNGLDLLSDVAKHKRMPPTIALASERVDSFEGAEELGATCIVGSGANTQDITTALHQRLA